MIEIHTTIDHDGRALYDVSDGVESVISGPTAPNATALVDEVLELQSVDVVQLLLHTPDQRLDSVMILREKKRQNSPSFIVPPGIQCVSLDSTSYISLS